MGRDGQDHPEESELEAGMQAGFGPPSESESFPSSVLLVLKQLAGSGRNVVLREEQEGALLPPIRGVPDDLRAAHSRGPRNYRILGELARGGMGLVLKGYDEDLCRDVALKVLHRELCTKAEPVQRFIEEAQIGGQLQHPGIVPIYELGLMADERPYFAMKLVKGKTLAALLSEREAKQSERRRFILIFEQVCQTVAYAHSRGVVHRDLKPSNVMVGAFGEVQVLDWGLAKVLASGGTADESRAAASHAPVAELKTVRTGSCSSHSRVGSVMGTPAYMPPEQARGETKNLDERCDVFALGAILCELLTGNPPYVGDREATLQLAAESKLEDAFARLSACDADEELVDLARRCLAAAIHERPRNASVVARVVQEQLTKAEERAHKAEVAAAKAQTKAAAERRARNLTLALGATMIVALLCGTGGYLAYDQHERARRSHLAESVRAAMNDATFERGRGSLEAAVAALGRAQAVTEQGDVDAALREEITTLRGKLESQLAELAARRAQDARDQKLLAALERASTLERHEAVDVIRVSVLGDDEYERSSPLPRTRRVDPDYDSLVDWVDRDRAYAAVFRDCGLDFDVLSDDAIAKALRGSAIAPDVAGYIEDWAQTVDREQDHSRSDRLVHVAELVDPDPWCSTVLQARTDGDRAGLLKRASDPQTAALPTRYVLLLARSLRWLGEIDASVRALETATRAHPSDFQIRLELGYSLEFRTKPPRFADALPHLETAVALRPTSVIASDYLGGVLRELGRDGDARVVLRRALELDPSNVRGRRLIAGSLWQTGERQAALAEIREATLSSPGSHEAWEELAYYLRELEDLDEAGRCVRNAIERKPECARSRALLAGILSKSGRVDDSIKQYEEAARLSVSYNIELGEALRQAHRYDEAIEAYGRAVKADPLRSHHGVFHSYKELGDLDRAINAIRQAVELSADESPPVRAFYLRNLGTGLRMHGEATAAIEPLRQSLALDPDQAATLKELGAALADLGQHDEAIDCFRRATSLAPAEVAYIQDYAYTLVRAGRYEEAIATARKGLELAPRNGDLFAHIGRACDKLGRPDEAVAAYERAVALAPDDVRLSALLAEEVDVGGFCGRADALLRGVIERIPDDSRTAWQRKLKFRALRQLGHCLQRHRHDPREAAALYRQALALYPIPEINTLRDLGHALEEIGDRQGAAEAYRKFLEYTHSGPVFPGGALTPDDAQLLPCLLAALPTDDAERTALLGELRQRRVASRRDAQALFHLATAFSALALLEIVDPTEAVSAFQEVLTLEPEHVDALVGLGWILALDPELGVFDPEGALDLVDRAASHAPDREDVPRLKGVVLYRIRRFEECIEVLRTTIAASKSPRGCVEDWCLLAMAYHELGDREQSKACLARIGEEPRPTDGWLDETGVKSIENEARGLIAR